jgi:hypothetical protein
MRYQNSDFSLTFGTQFLKFTLEASICVLSGTQASGALCLSAELRALQSGPLEAKLGTHLKTKGG